MYRVSPPLPSEWPPRPAAPLYYYAYAYGFDRRISDAERLSAPWARLEVHSAGQEPAELRVLSREITETGIHGVRPLTREESAVYDLGPRVEAYLGSLDHIPNGMVEEVAQLRKYYCAWCYDSGVADEIRPYHEEFFRWLQCDEKR